MNVLVQLRNVELPTGVEDLIQRRVRFALGRFADRIRSVRVRLSDLNAERGGVDKHCLIEAALTPRGSVIAEVTDESVEPAVTRAAERVARRVRTEAQRRRETRRRPARTPRAI